MFIQNKIKAVKLINKLKKNFDYFCTKDKYPTKAQMNQIIEILILIRNTIDSDGRIQEEITLKEHLEGDD